MTEINFTDLPCDIKRIIFKINKDRDIIEKKFNKVLEQMYWRDQLKNENYDCYNIYILDQKLNLKWIKNEFPNCDYEIILKKKNNRFELKKLDLYDDIKYFCYKELIEYSKKLKKIKSVSITYHEPTDDDDDY